MRPPHLRVAAVAAVALTAWLLELSGALAFGAGLGLGSLFAHLGWGRPSWAQRWGQNLLKLGIVALGAGYEWSDVCAGGSQALLATMGTLALALGLGLGLTRRWGLPRDVGLLVTVGTAICGGSAIAAASPALGARSEHVGMALGVVFLLNAVALLLFPLVGRWLQLDPAAFGTWCALAIHDTSSVVGAASTFGPQALEIAVLTKLGRALWIVPVVIGLSLLRRRSEPAQCTQRLRWLPPGFIVAFLAAAALVQGVPSLRPLGTQLAGYAGNLLPISLFALGLALEPSALRSRDGGKVLAVALFLWATLSLVSLAWVSN